MVNSLATGGGASTTPSCNNPETCEGNGPTWWCWNGGCDIQDLWITDSSGIDTITSAHRGDTIRLYARVYAPAIVNYDCRDFCVEFYFGSEGRVGCFSDVLTLQDTWDIYITYTIPTDAQLGHYYYQVIEKWEQIPFTSDFTVKKACVECESESAYLLKIACCHTNGCYWYNNHCNATPPTSCSQMINETECQLWGATLGCEYYCGACQATATSCEQYCEEDCEDKGCSWWGDDTTDPGCHQYPPTCEDIASEILCKSPELDCHWYKATGDTQQRCHTDCQTCSTYNYNDCGGSQCDCYWWESDQKCHDTEEPSECDEGEHKCIGCDRYTCIDGHWVLTDPNSTICCPPERCTATTPGACLSDSECHWYGDACHEGCPPHCSHLQYPVEYPSNCTTCPGCTIWVQNQVRFCEHGEQQPSDCPTREDCDDTGYKWWKDPDGIYRCHNYCPPNCSDISGIDGSGKTCGECSDSQAHQCCWWPMINECRTHCECHDYDGLEDSCNATGICHYYSGQCWDEWLPDCSGYNLSECDACQNQDGAQCVKYNQGCHNNTLPNCYQYYCCAIEPTEENPEPCGHMTECSDCDILGNCVWNEAIQRCQEDIICEVCGALSEEDCRYCECTEDACHWFVHEGQCGEQCALCDYDDQNQCTSCSNCKWGLGLNQTLAEQPFGNCHGDCLIPCDDIQTPSVCNSCDNCRWSTLRHKCLNRVPVPFPAPSTIPRESIPRGTSQPRGGVILA